jgi:hypothetical protein
MNCKQAVRELLPDHSYILFSDFTNKIKTLAPVTNGNKTNENHIKTALGNLNNANTCGFKTKFLTTYENVNGQRHLRFHGTERIEY